MLPAGEVKKVIPIERRKMAFLGSFTPHPCGGSRIGESHLASAEDNELAESIKIISLPADDSGLTVIISGNAGKTHNNFKHGKTRQYRSSFGLHCGNP